MKKIFLLFLLSLASQSYALQYTYGSAYLFSDLLLWKLTESGNENWAQNIAPDNTYRPVNIIGATFNTQAGYRIGAGYRCGDCWDTNLYYTHYQTHTNAHAHGHIFSSFLGNFYANNTNGVNFGPTYQRANLTWHFNFNTVDAELGHTFVNNCIVKLRPFFGLKAAVINQHINTHWHDPITPTDFTIARESITNDFSGIGPAVGLNTTWPLYQANRFNFNVIGNLSGAILWGRWHFKDHYKNNAPTSTTIHNHSLNNASTMARGNLGVEWSTSIATASVSLRLSYEAQVWFNQLQYYSFNMGKSNQLMSLQGGVLDLGINF